ncbi:anaerobic dimethyl sulfoxide reductase subunit A [Salmonella bongori]|nr:anaerobic dimethyl sulfoxide reductase subunit A [Salmonella bongori]
MEIKEWLNTTITRRDAIAATAKVGAAVTLSQAITLPFATTVQAQDTTVIPKETSGEIVRHSACLVNCGSRCPLRVIVKDDRIVRIEPEDAKRRRGIWRASNSPLSARAFQPLARLQPGSH